jgi:acetamidase/formamidase
MKMAEISEVEKTILNNQLIMMKVLNELLHTPGVTAHRGETNYHWLLRNHIAATEEVLEWQEQKATLYEYAGFKYLIRKIDGVVSLTPAPGQLGAAAKERHIRNATECYLQDHKDGTLK